MANYPDPIIGYGGVKSPVRYPTATDYRSALPPQPIFGYGGVEPGSLFADESSTNPRSTSDWYQQSTQNAGRANALASGLSAGQQFGALAGGGGAETAIGIGGAMASGAAMGALAGGPIGAGIGAGAAAITSGLEAYLTYKKQKQYERETKRLIKRAEEQQRKADAKAEDALRYDRLSAITARKEDQNRAAVQGKWNQWVQMSNWLQNQMQQQKSMKSDFIAQGWV